MAETAKPVRLSRGMHGKCNVRVVDRENSIHGRGAQSLLSATRALCWGGEAACNDIRTGDVTGPISIVITGRRLLRTRRVVHERRVVPPGRSTETKFRVTLQNLVWAVIVYRW